MWLLKRSFLLACYRRHVGGRSVASYYCCEHLVQKCLNLLTKLKRLDRENGSWYAGDVLDARRPLLFRRPHHLVDGLVFGASIRLVLAVTYTVLGYCSVYNGRTLGACF